mmetsp:Transcript_12058/g.17577  ORF Transcript_12058/g.17577 Transcript_12058/m.17577 type:complete len:353 (+) Transcript_12058:163-1221(+)
MKFGVFLKQSQKNTELFNLLNLSPYDEEERKRLKGDDIIREARRDPRAAKLKYQFLKIGEYYPLQMAVRLGAKPDVLEALYKAYPPAIKAENLYGDTALHLALRYRTNPDVILFLLDKWPESTRKRDRSECTPLHVACCFDAPWKVVSQLVNVWPAALREKTSTGYTPLSHACMYKAPLDVVSLLLERCPTSIKEKTATGCTPLHLACGRREAPLEVIIKLLDMWPEAIIERNEHCKTPLGNLQETETPQQVRTLLSYVYRLLTADVDDVLSEKALRFFTAIQWEKGGTYGTKRIGWQRGVTLCLNRNPGLIQDLNIQLNELPDLFTMVGHGCSITTLWDILINQQDVFTGI